MKLLSPKIIKSMAQIYILKREIHNNMYRPNYKKETSLNFES